jgi:hypothetical protein
MRPSLFRFFGNVVIFFWVLRQRDFLKPAILLFYMEAAGVAQTPISYRLRKVAVLLRHFHERTGLVLPPECDECIDLLYANIENPASTTKAILQRIRPHVGSVSTNNELAKADISLLLADIDALIAEL